MEIQLQTQGFDVTEAIAAHARKEVLRNLNNASDHVTSVDVFLSDINGPRGGDDKKALLRVRLSSRLVVHVEKVNADLYVAISVAARRARHTVKRTLRKHRRIERSALRRLRKNPVDLKAGRNLESDDQNLAPAY